jgi:hypothetical protein
MKKITEHAQSKSRSIHQPPASGQRPKLVTRQNVRTAVAELIDYHQRFERFFQRHEQSDWSWFYLCGQLSNLERKSIEPMVLSLLGDPACDPRLAAVYQSKSLGRSGRR